MHTRTLLKGGCIVMIHNVIKTWRMRCIVEAGVVGACWGILREPCTWATSGCKATRMLETCRQVIVTCML